MLVVSLVTISIVNVLKVFLFSGTKSAMMVAEGGRRIFGNSLCCGGAVSLSAGTIRVGGNEISVVCNDYGGRVYIGRGGVDGGNRRVMYLPGRVIVAVRWKKVV